MRASRSRACSLVGVDKAKLQPFGRCLPGAEVLQRLHEVPAVAFGIDRFVMTLAPRCVFERSADHGAGCSRATEMRVDVPRLKGVPYLEPGTAIYPEDLDAWEKKAGLKVGSGDIVLIRTGRWALRDSKGPWHISTNAAGLYVS